jgi:uncharacterized repeat protein (TIGR03803 family)
VASADAAQTRPLPHTPAETVLWNFNGADGDEPLAGLIADKNGAFYGTTVYGGSFGNGTVFKITPARKGYSESVLWSFGSGGGGRQPTAGLISDAQGALYGTTTAGGGVGYGTVFKLAPSGSGYAESVLYSFCSKPQCVDGNTPGYGYLTLDAHGNIYGTTLYGGAYDSGTVFKLTPSGSGYSESVLHSFCAKPTCNDGQYPSGLIIDATGALYGTTSQGGFRGACLSISGPIGCGVAFKLVPSGSIYSDHILWYFGKRPNDGVSPSGALIADATGTLYGGTNGGGAQCTSSGGCGTVFALTPAGRKYTERILWSFNGTDGVGAAALVAGKNGGFYGLTGGITYQGAVFTLTPSGNGYAERILWSFGSGSDGSLPEGLLENNGALYGTTEIGGNGCGSNIGCGTVFRLVP